MARIKQQVFILELPGCTVRLTHDACTTKFGIKSCCNMHVALPLGVFRFVIGCFICFCIECLVYVVTDVSFLFPNIHSAIKFQLNGSLLQAILVAHRRAFTRRNHLDLVCTEMCDHIFGKLTHPQTKTGPSIDKNWPIDRQKQTMYNIT